MRKNCNIPNPLMRDGTSQTERFPASLDPEYVKLDDRGISELLAFIQRYAATLQYYDIENTPNGDWQPFVENDVSMVIAHITEYRAQALNDCFQLFVPVLVRAKSFTPRVKSTLSVIFDLVFTCASAFNNWYERTLSGLSIRTELKRIITSKLNQALRTTVAAYLYADANHLLEQVERTAVPTDCRRIIDTTKRVLSKPFHTDWIADPTATSQDWNTYLLSIEPDADVFKDTATASSRLTVLFDTFYTALRQLIDRSSGLLKETLESWPQHEPHLALMLSFLKLFAIAQKDLNALTRKHLEFYYEKVLRLESKPQQSDRVYLVIEPAKQVKTYNLKKGTQLKAGKDLGGKKIVYQTLRDIAVNQATVDSLKTIFVDRDDNYRVYAAPEANSKDGQGAPFEDAEPRFKPFGQGQRIAESSLLRDEALTMGFAEIGFALASPILQLNEGQRTITIDLISTTNIPTGVHSDQFEVRLSGAEKWLLSSTDVTSLEQHLIFTIELGSEFPAVVNYDSKLLGGGFETHFPVVQLILKNQGETVPGQTTSPYAYASLKDIVLRAIEVTVEVTGLRNPIVQNDSGLLDASKPFQPFGARPVKGAALYIGSDEVFRKEVSWLRLNIEWLDVPSNLATHYSVYSRVLGKTFSNSTFKGEVSELINNRWEKLKDPSSGSSNHSVDLFKNNATDPIGPSFTNLTVPRTPLLGPIERYNNQTQQGFIKLELSAPTYAFGHSDFTGLYTQQILEINKGEASGQTDKSQAYQYINSQKNASAMKTAIQAQMSGAVEPSLPEPPYTPVIKTITLDYRSQQRFDLNPALAPAGDFDRFFHIYPFGQLRPKPTTTQTVRLMPTFEQNENGGTTETQGELYIGLAGLDPPQQISLLFRVIEGSADPELPKQPVLWSYLVDQKWKPFKRDAIVIEGTDGLLRSGITVFNIPSEANNRHTVLTDGLHWLRASVSGNTAAVCDLIDIKAQAVTAEFVDLGNHPSVLAQPLPAKTIRKLVQKQAAVKSISQPCDSFGGTMRESGRQYYTRVSERLRHKGRAISIWDYERLVLERFPEIYRAKCINHSTYNYCDPQQELTIDSSEFAPGYVTMVVIPNLNGQSAINPLEPRASLHTLEQIRKYLSGLISPFAARRLRVINPLFEQIQVTLGVEFYPSYDRGETEKRLNQDILRSLSPWAYQQQQEISFGGRVHRSVILNFIEERPYVDYVTDFRMDHMVGETRNTNLEFAVPTTSRSVFVSAPQHTINVASSCL